MSQYPPSLGGQLNVLVISPSLELRKLVRSAMGQEPLLDSRISECENLDDARPRLETLEIDLAVLDTEIEDVRWLAKRGNDAAIVFFSDGSPELRHESVAAGATDFFSRAEFNGNPELLWASLRQTIRYHAIRMRHRHLARIVEERSKQIVRLTQRLWRTSPFDHRTGWFSHGQIIDRCQEEIGRAIRYGLPLSLALVDLPILDHCEQEHGLEFTSDLLTQLSGRIRLISRHSDIVGHYGPESFLLILTNTDHEGGLRFCQRLNQSLQPPVHLSGVTLSLVWYVALVSRHGGATTTPTDLLNALEHRIEQARESSTPGTIVAD